MNTYFCCCFQLNCLKSMEELSILTSVRERVLLRGGSLPIILFRYSSLILGFCIGLPMPTTFLSLSNKKVWKFSSGGNWFSWFNMSVVSIHTQDKESVLVVKKNRLLLCLVGKKRTVPELNPTLLSVFSTHLIVICKKSNRKNRHKLKSYD